MPSDSTIIIASLLPASVGACALLLAHGQRLRHERKLTDIAALRAVLDAGAELLVRAEQTAQAMYRIEIGPKRLEISVEPALLAYEKRLLLWVEPKDAVSTAWVAIVGAYRSVAAGSMDETSVAFTIDRYGHLLPDSHAERGAQLDAFLDRADTSARLAQLDAASADS